MLLIPMIFDSFIDSEQVLRLSRVVDRHSWPRSFLSLVNVLGRKYLLKGILDRTTSYHFLYLRRLCNVANPSPNPPQKN